MVYGIMVQWRHDILAAAWQQGSMACLHAGITTWSPLYIWACWAVSRGHAGMLDGGMVKS